MAPKNQTPPEPEYVDVPEVNETAITTHAGEPTELAVKPTAFEGMTFSNPDDIPDLDSATVGVNVAPQYMEFLKAGETVRAVYNGMTTITSTKNGDRREIPTAVFQNRNGIYINSGANLVNQLRNLKPGTLVSISFLGKEKTSTGNEIKKFEVHILNLNILARKAIADEAAQQSVNQTAKQSALKVKSSRGEWYPNRDAE